VAPRRIPQESQRGKQSGSSCLEYRRGRIGRA
jgi:hypothetical protein